MEARTGWPVDDTFVTDDDEDSDATTESNLSKIPIILEQGEGSITKDVGPFNRRCNARHRSTFYDYACCFDNDMRKKSQTQWKSQFKAHVQDVWKVEIGTIRRDCWSVSHQLGRFSMETMLKKSSVSRTQRVTFSDFVLRVGWVNENPTLNTVGQQQLSWFKDAPQYRTMDTTDGEPMEFEWNNFPGFTTLQFVRKLQEFIDKIGDPAQFPGRIIFVSILMTSYGELKSMNRNALPVAILADCLHKYFQQDVVGRRSGTKRNFFTQRKTPRSMEQSRWIDHDHAEKADSQFSESRL